MYVVVYLWVDVIVNNQDLEYTSLVMFLAMYREL
jgi:hypothetical protein